MKPKILTVLAVLALTGFVATTVPAHAGTNVNVNLGLPAPVVVAPQPVYVEQPPEMVVIPRSNVYFAPGVSVWTFSSTTTVGGTAGGIGGLYRGSGYNGPWAAVGPRYVPAPVPTGSPRTTALSTVTRSRCRTASGRRPTGSTAGSIKGKSKATSTGITTIRRAGHRGPVNYVNTIFTGKKYA